MKMETIFSALNMSQNIPRDKEYIHILNVDEFHGFRHRPEILTFIVLCLLFLVYSEQYIITAAVVVSFGGRKTTPRAS